MNRRALGWTGLGMAVGVAGLVGAAGLAMPPPSPTRDWPLPCVRALGADYEGLDVETRSRSERGSLILFGIDKSPSNRADATEQLRRSVEAAVALGERHGTGIFFISDRSDRSATPDLGYELEPGRQVAQTPALPCPECSSSSLFEQRCRERLEASLEQRRQDLQERLDRADQALRAQREERVRRWQLEVEDWWPRPGTSILAFLDKIADLPALRTQAQGSRRPVKVVVFGDLEEARSKQRASLKRMMARLRRDPEQCPELNPIPETLRAVHLILLQTRVDGVDDERWGAGWEALLRCAGVKVSRFRYSPAIALSEYVPELRELLRAQSKNDR